MNIITKAALGLVAGATALTAAAPAEAQYRGWHGRDRGGDVVAGAVIGGVAGLAIGSAIAADRRDRWHRDRYWRGGDRYWRGGDPYWRGGPRWRGHDPYWGGPRRGFRQRCVTRRVYDPYIGRRVRVRYC
jgi:hypothetical protein